MSNQIAAVISALSSQFPERNEAITAIMCAIVAKEHAVVYGPPGTGKSLLVREITKAIDKSYFEYLLTRFTEPSEIFGPIDPNAFRLGKYARVTTGKFSECEVAFLDEIFKANSAILNSFLTILNERTYDSGSGPKPVPLMSCIGASNELPEGAELEALYDRILVRLEVGYISDDDAFRDMLLSSGINLPSIKIDIAAEQAQAKRVTISTETVEALINLRNACKKAGIAVSDRRWKQCLNLVRSHAHVEGRTSTVPDDLEILESVLWHKPSDKVLTSKTIQSVISPSGSVAVEMLDAARHLIANLPASADMGQIGSAVKDVAEIAKRLEGLPSGRRVDSAKVEIKAIKAQIAKRALRAAGIEV